MDLNNQTTKNSIFNTFTPIKHKIFGRAKNNIENPPNYNFQSTQKRYSKSQNQQIIHNANAQYGIIHYESELSKIPQPRFEQLLHNQEKLELEITKEHNKLENKLSEILEVISDEKKLVNLVLEQLKESDSTKSKIKFKKRLKLINNKFVFVEKSEPKIKPEILEKYLKELKKIDIDRKPRTF